MKSILKVLVLVPLLFISSCTKDSNPVEPGTPTAPSTGGKISTGGTIDLGSQTIGTSGGTFTINKTGDPLNGFQITVPANGFAQSQTFAVSYAPITSHQLGGYINPVSPLIKITCNGGYSADQMKVKVPIKLPAGSFAMGFFYDETTGALEPLPVSGLDSTSITIGTRHLSPQDAQLGKGLRKSANILLGNIFISSILKSAFQSQPIITTGFTPGVDDWDFPNFGSYVAPSGQCAGQSATAIWYYYEHKLKGEPGLYHRYDKLEAMWCDNPKGYRFASTIQADMEWHILLRSWADWSFPDLVFDAFMYSMIVTGKPQLVGLWSSTDQVGHAMIIYKIDVLGGKMYVADPNYPNNTDPLNGAPTLRVIEFVPGLISGSFKPYFSALKAGDKGYSFDKIEYMAITSHVEWAKISQRWIEFQNGTIGNDRFPSYKLTETRNATDFVDGLDTDLDSVKVISTSPACSFPLPGTADRQFTEADDANGYFLDTTKTLGVLTIGLAPGDNTFGMYMTGCSADTHRHYLDFKWIKVHRHMTLSIASAESNGAPISIPGTKNKLYTFIAKSVRPVPKDGKVRYDWSFGDSSPVTSVNNDSTITHTFTKEEVDTIKVTFYYNGTKISQASAAAKIAAAPPAITGIFPSAGKIGDTVKVQGKNFGSDQTKGSVIFTSGVTATGILSWIDTLIALKVPQGTQTGVVTVTVNSQTSNSVSFTLLSPTITSIIPAAGKVGDTVKVQGKYFGIDPTKGVATFNGVTATGILSWVDTAIVLKVPQGAQSGPVTVTVNSATSNAVTFTVTTTAGPVITSLTPNVGRQKDTISIQGNNFGTDKTKGFIQFTGDYVPSTGILSWNNTGIRAVVPSNAVTGPVIVNVSSVTSNQVLFTVDTTAWIDEVYHSQSSSKLNWALPGRDIVVSGRSFGYPKAGTLLFNGLPVQVSSWGKELVTLTLPSSPAGLVNVSVRTNGGLLSNSKPFTVGIPFDTLMGRSTIEFHLDIKMRFTDSASGTHPMTSAYINSSQKITSWASDGFTAALTNPEGTITGTLKVTFTPGAVSASRLELNYSNLAPSYLTLHLVMENIVGGANNYFYLQYPVNGLTELKNRTTLLTGTITSLQRTYPIDGYMEGADGSIIVSFWGVNVY